MFVLVTVVSGIPESVEIFDDHKAAREAEIEARKGLNLEDDETGIFEVLK